MKSLKLKLILAISTLIFVLFGVASALLMLEKQREITFDIFRSAHSFAELTAEDIVSSADLYLAQKNFVHFNSEVSDLIAKFSNLSFIQVIGYSGTVRYDSLAEYDAQYEGPQRVVQDTQLLEQIQSRNASVKTLNSDRVLYLKTDAEGNLLYVDEGDNSVQTLGQDEKIEYLVQPATNDSAVVYGISYANLQDRLNQTILRAALLAVFGVIIGVFLAYFFATGITNPLKKLTKGAAQIATGNFAQRVQVKGHDELSDLANAFNSMAQDLESSMKAKMYKERVAKELELAAKIQRELLPKEIPKIAGLDISAGLLPAEEIGGDCYDFIPVNNKDLVMYLGDVTGHGVHSGLVVAVANALIYNYAGRTDIKNLLVSVNKILKDKTSSNMFMTLVMLHWAAQEKKLQYCSAGHEQMLHYSAKDGKVTVTEGGGMALGMLPDLEKMLQVHEISLEVGDALIVYSDGIPEAWRNDVEMYGMSRLRRAASDYGGLPTALSIRNAILADVKEFMGDWKQMDDITLMILKRTEDGAVKAQLSPLKDAEQYLGPKDPQEQEPPEPEAPKPDVGKKA